MDTKIRILVVDDHLMVRRGIAQLLANAPEVEIVGEASCERVAFQMVDRDQRLAAG